MKWILQSQIIYMMLPWHCSIVYGMPYCHGM